MVGPGKTLTDGPQSHRSRQDVAMISTSPIRPAARTASSKHASVALLLRREQFGPWQTCTRYLAGLSAAGKRGARSAGNRGRPCVDRIADECEVGGVDLVHVSLERQRPVRGRPLACIFHRAGDRLGIDELGVW